MQSATNSQDEGPSSEMKEDDAEDDACDNHEEDAEDNADDDTENNVEDDVETDEDQEEKVPIKRTRFVMKLPPTLSVYSAVHTASRQVIRINKKIAYMEKIRQMKEQEKQRKKKKKIILKCLFCFKVCENKSTLQKHERAHTKEKPFRCEKCGTGFSQASGRNVHEKGVCLKIKSTCPICGVLFTNTANLTNHLKFTHKMEERINCDICNISVRTDFKRHLKSKRHIKAIARVQDEAEEQFTISDQARRLQELHQVLFSTDGVN